MVYSEKCRAAIPLEPIPAVSPSLAESLRICPLQALLNRSFELRQYILGNPKAWLGIAYHEVLERLWSCERLDLGDEEWIDYLWEGSINRLQNAAAIHPLDRRFSNCENWPGYHLSHAMVRIRARQALAEQPRSREASPAMRAPDGPRRERTLYAMGSKLKGQPDVVAGDEIREYKSGSIVEDLPDGSNRVKEGYVRQLRLYGHLVKENTGVCPSKGKLLPMQGNPVQIRLTAEECEAEAQAAIDLLDRLNAAILTINSIEQLASPSEESCSWCSHKTHCQAFWSTVTEDWWDDNHMAAVSGRLSETPREVHAGRSFTLKVEVLAGNNSLDTCVIGPFDKSIHSNVEFFSVGDYVRIVGCYRKQDRTITTTPWTVCFRQSEWPEICTTQSSGR